VDAFAIFLLQNLLNFVAYGLIASWWVWPRVSRLPRATALSYLLAPHALRAIGATILVPTVVSGAVPREFAEPVAYGDLLTTVLAIAALIALRYGASAGIALAWIANVVGILDLANALVQGIRFDASHLAIGSFWFVVTLLVPILWITHVMSFMVLLRRPR